MDKVSVFLQILTESEFLLRQSGRVGTARFLRSRSVDCKYPLLILFCDVIGFFGSLRNLPLLCRPIVFYCFFTHNWTIRQYDSLLCYSIIWSIDTFLRYQMEVSFDVAGGVIAPLIEAPG